LAGVKQQLKHMLEDAEEYGVFESTGPFAKLERGGESIPVKDLKSLEKPAKKKRR
jgi:hypothetical protein